MRIAICHYHLQRGGVTRIILHTVQALQACGMRVTVITGQAPPPSWDMPCQVVKELHYDNISGGVTDNVLYDLLHQAAQHALGARPDIWHFHNHSLGKNLALPAVIRRLADQGEKLLLQIHDFPEDGRPANYSRQLTRLGGGHHHRLSELLYPSAPHIHYALLNSRDLEFMRQAGADPATLHLLPNPVELKPPEAVKTGSRAAPVHHERHTGKRLWLYPTRAIRRKNIGEFLLWAAAARGEDTFALTMAPENPLERPFYEAWKALSGELGLPVMFEYAVKSGMDFPSMIAGSHAVVTTSVAEGFGMAFLEPWVLSRPVCGRNLAEITKDFIQHGISLPWMYNKLMVPVQLLDSNALKRKIRSVQADYLSAYQWGKDMPPLPRLDETWIHDGRIDFGCLDEEFQAAIIRKITSGPHRSAELSPDFLPDSLPDPGDDMTNIIENNRRLIKEHFSLENYGARVIQTYRKIHENEPQPVMALDGICLLENFLSPERLTMLRMEGKRQ